MVRSGLAAVPAEHQIREGLFTGGGWSNRPSGRRPQRGSEVRLRLGPSFRRGGVTVLVPGRRRPGGFAPAFSASATQGPRRHRIRGGADRCAAWGLHTARYHLAELEAAGARLIARIDAV